MLESVEYTVEQRVEHHVEVKIQHHVRPCRSVRAWRSYAG